MHLASFFERHHIQSAHTFISYGGVRMAGAACMRQRDGKVFAIAASAGAALHTTTALHMLDLFGKDSSATAAAGFDEL